MQAHLSSERDSRFEIPCSISCWRLTVRSWAICGMKERLSIHKMSTIQRCKCQASNVSQPSGQANISSHEPTAQVLHHAGPLSTHKPGGAHLCLVIAKVAGLERLHMQMPRFRPTGTDAMSWVIAARDRRKAGEV